MPQDEDEDNEHIPNSDGVLCAQVFATLSAHEAKDALSVDDACYLEKHGVHFKHSNFDHSVEDPYSEAVSKEVRSPNPFSCIYVVGKHTVG